jgi:hypothetical protein
MQIELKEEHEDGSATFNITYDAAELEQLVNFAVVRMLEDAMKKMEADLPSVGGTTDES